MRLFLFGFFSYYICMISKEEIEHLKDLARVEFGEAETKKLTKDLGDILSYIDELKKVDVSGAPEMTHALEGVKNVFRKDSAESSLRGAAEFDKQSELASDLINAFPDKKGDYLKVKSIL